MFEFATLHSLHFIIYITHPSFLSIPFTAEQSLKDELITTNVHSSPIRELITDPFPPLNPTLSNVLSEIFTLDPDELTIRDSVRSVGVLESEGVIEMDVRVR